MPLDPGPATIEVDRFADVPGAGVLGTTPLTVPRPDGARDGDAFSLTIEGDAAALLDADGSPAPTEVTGADLPLRLYVRGVAAGEATLRVTPEGCDPVEVALRVVLPAPLAGRVRPEAPGFGFDTVFADAEPVAVALDPAVHPDRVGATAEVYVVAHRAPEAIVADPTLLDATGFVETVTLGGGDGIRGDVVWEAADAGGDVLGAPFDVVLDLDGDGAWSPGDLADVGPDGEGIGVVGDLAVAGPHEVETEDVSGGDWLGERAWWPADLADLGPRPLVVISHGNGHEYTWYDYLGEHLASWGYVVMAHENQTEPGIETASFTTLTNTDWFLGHLDRFGEGALTGLVDADRLVWIGHSRGGEGVVRAYARVADTDYVPETFTLASVRGIVSIAPTVFNEVTVSDPHDVRYHVLWGSSDGDVTGGPDSPFAQSWRLWAADTGTKSTTYVYGASHNDFNCCGPDDGAGPDQISRPDAQLLARAYLLAAVADAVDADPYARAALARAPERFPATRLDTTVVGTWHDADALVLDDFQLNSDPGRASSGAPVTWTVGALVEGRLDDADLELGWSGEDPMNGMTQADLTSDHAAGEVFEWEAPAWIAYELPSEVRDWTGRTVLSVRACQGTRHPLTVDWEAPVDLAFTLTDGAGVTVTRSATPVGTIPTPYLRGRLGEGKGWSNAFATLRVPLVDFTAGGTGLDLADIRSVRVEVGGDGQAPEGRLGLDDLEVSR